MRLYAWERYEPIEATKAGLAIAKHFGENCTIGTGRDGHSVSRFVRRCVVNGLVNYGSQVLDFRLVPSQVIRYGTVKQRLDGAVYVSYFKNEVQIHVYGKDGRNLSAEEHIKIRVASEGIESASAIMADMGSLMQYTNGTDDYVDYLLSKVKDSVGGKWLIDTQGDPVSLVVESVFDKLHTEYRIYNPMFTSEGELKTREMFLQELRDGRFDHGVVVERDELLGATYYHPTGGSVHYHSLEELILSTLAGKHAS